MDTKQTTTPTHNVNPATNIPDSGSRSEFQTGAVRDAAPGKGIPSEIPPCVIRRLSVRYEEGAIKYDRGNWRKGIPLSRYYDGIMRHAMSAAEGDKSEDHLAAVLFNAAGFMWTEEQIEKGELPPSLNDLPFYNASNQNEHLANLDRKTIESVVDGIAPYQSPVVGLNANDKPLNPMDNPSEESKKDCTSKASGIPKKGQYTGVETLLEMGANFLNAVKNEAGEYRINGLSVFEAQRVINEIVQWCFQNDATFYTDPNDELPYHITLNRYNHTVRHSNLITLLSYAKSVEHKIHFETAIDKTLKIGQGIFTPGQLYGIKTIPAEWPKEFRIFSDKMLPVTIVSDSDGKTYTHFSILNGEIVFGESKRKLSEVWVGNAGYWVP